LRYANSDTWRRLRSAHSLTIDPTSTTRRPPWPSSCSRHHRCATLILRQIVMTRWTDARSQILQPEAHALPRG